MPRLEGDPNQFEAIKLSTRSMSEVHTGNWRSLKPAIDHSKCTNCMICWKYCPEACVQIATGSPVIDMNYCKGCGICAFECPTKCISMNADAGL
ncbi:MAG: 4Fe-4S binding protein [Elusimicrobiota bacterium]